jgi:hypothetical protein
MRRITRWGALALGTVCGTAAAQAPETKDFAYGLTVTSVAGQPVRQFQVPDRLYQGVTRADLGDLRVFNSGGIVVPHALCPGAEAAAESVREESLNVFALQPGARAPDGGDTRVSVQTPSGTSVQVVERSATAIVSAPAPPAAPETFVVDATAVREPLRALQLAWSTPDGASQAQVKVEASDDLDHWRTVVAGTTLLHVTSDGRTLDRNRIELPVWLYRYLRLARADGPVVRIERVTAEVVQPGTPPQPFWFAADPAPPGAGDAFEYTTGRLAPVEAARVELASANMVLRVALESRRAPEMNWQQHWSGDVSSVRAGNGEPAASAVTFAAVADPYWRVRVLRGAESLGSGRPTLRLGYHPGRLRFLAQGAEPFVVAYGSARVPPAEMPGCDALLAQFQPVERAGMIGLAQVSAAPAGAFGGPDVLTPPPKPTPVRQIVLWAVLVLGAAVLVAMALTLLRRLRETEAAR